ncbi:MAG: glycosyltransferase family 39 protein [Anaerolineae bacterium]|nr:glycosyltransferase family 39 protein [Anaerolineae bacterium]
MKTSSKLLLICLGALALRLALATIVHHPGIGDSNHYYNVGTALVEGRGFNIDYIWQYHVPPPPGQLMHPEDHWMPLTSVIVAASFTLFGEGVFSAILPFILMGALVPLVAFYAARQFECSEETALWVALLAAVLPEFVLNSLRSDTTIPNLLLVVGSVLLLIRGLQRGGIWTFAVSGLLAGLAYLTRSDSLLIMPMLAVVLIVYALRGKHFSGRWRYAVLVPLAALLVALPWMLRNQALFGTPTTPQMSTMFFLTDHREHYFYDSSQLTLEGMLARQTPAQLIGKRLFELAASVKLMYTTLDVFLPVAVAGGLLLVLAARDRDRLLTIAPVLILLLGATIFYAVLVPYKSQGGSFKKVYITLIPLLLPLAGYALERVIHDPRLRAGTVLLAALFMTANAVELVRADATLATSYRQYIEQVAATALALPDTNGDGDIILMAQDPFALRMAGVRSVMIPMEDRDTVLEVAKRYRVDYMMVPPERPSLDALYEGTESDPRFIEAAAIPGTNARLYELDYD